MNGAAYTSVQIQKIANTLAAATLAYYARDDSENAATNWAQVITFASAGMSTGTPFDFVGIGDGCNAWCHELLTWMNSLDTGRLWTRVAHFMDPATQRDPFPLGTGNPQPNSVDKRLGNGTFGNASMVSASASSRETPAAEATLLTRLRRSSVPIVASIISPMSAMFATT